MDEDSNSWIRRTKFSHTVCHRLDPSRVASLPVGIRFDEFSRSKSRPESADLYKRSATLKPQIQTNPLTNEQRSVSPIPETVLNDTFKEARLDKKRFSTPISRRNTSDKYSCSSSYPDVKKSPSTSPLRRSLSPLKGFIKSKAKKDSSWTKYFDHGGGRVTAVEAAEEHMVDLSQLFLGNRFAHGAHSRLYHGVYKDEPVAVKMICVPDDDENGTLAARLEKQFNREVTHLSRLHHPNVIRFVAACRQPPVYCIVTEFLSEGSLRAYLHKLEHKTLPLQKIISAALEISRGMAYVHSRGVIHRDLKPENVLIDEGFHMKIADFGIACEEVYRDSFAEDLGTYRWMAPEMIKDRSYGRRVDVYSYGLILWEMVSGHIPYEEMEPIPAAFAVVKKNLRPAFPKDCPEPMRALIEQCWSVQPDKRPEFWQVVKVLEEFESSLGRDGTLTLVQNSICQDHKKGFLHWIQKLGSPNPNPESLPKP